MKELFFRDLGFELSSKVISIFKRVVLNERDQMTLKKLEDAMYDFETDMIIAYFSKLISKYSDAFDDEDSAVLKSFEIIVSLL